MKKAKQRKKSTTHVHDEAYDCSRCGGCYVCSHSLEWKETATAGTNYWWTCRDGFSKPAYLDHGQFAGLRNVQSSKGISWEKYG